MSCPHLVLALLVLTGLQGIPEGLPQPPLVEGDPADLSNSERERLGAQGLPGSLPEALEALERVSIRSASAVAATQRIPPSTPSPRRSAAATAFAGCRW